MNANHCSSVETAKPKPPPQWVDLPEEWWLRTSAPRQVSSDSEPVPLYRSRRRAHSPPTRMEWLAISTTCPWTSLPSLQVIFLDVLWSGHKLMHSAKWRENGAVYDRWRLTSFQAQAAGPSLPFPPQTLCAPCLLLRLLIHCPDALPNHPLLRSARNFSPQTLLLKVIDFLCLPLPRSLCKISAKDPKLPLSTPEGNKQLKKDAATFYKTIQSYMGERKSKTNIDQVRFLYTVFFQNKRWFSDGLDTVWSIREEAGKRRRNRRSTHQSAGRQRKGRECQVRSIFSSRLSL